MKEHCQGNLCSLTYASVQLPTSTLLSFITWSIWKNRNNQIFNDSGHPITPNQAIIHAVEFVSLTDSTPSKTITLSSHIVSTREDHKFWKPPIEGVFKLNIDGSYHDSTGKGVAGGVFRNHLGDWIFGFTKSFFSPSPLYSETMALLLGLQIGVEKGFTSLVIETDSKALAGVFADADDHAHIQGGQLPR